MTGKVPDPTDEHVGSRVRTRRCLLGMTQEELGDALGITYQQVQKYEKGQNRIAASRLQHIAHILQVPLSFFFSDAADETVEDGAPVSDYVGHFLAVPDGLALAEAFARITDKKLRRRIADLVVDIAAKFHDGRD